MNKIAFTYLNKDYFIQCNNDDKMSLILSKIYSKIDKSRDDISFFYNGEKINEELSFNECITDFDRNNKIMKVSIIDNKSLNDNNNSTNKDNNNNISLQTSNSLNNKYENFHLSELKELISYQTLYEISLLFILYDGRIVTIQLIYYEGGFGKEDSEETKLCVYSIKNNRFECEINITYEYVNRFIQMDDGNVIAALNDKIKIIKFHKNSIEEISTENKRKPNIKKLLNENLFIRALADEQPPQTKGFFAAIHYVYDYFLYKYDKGKIKEYKNITKLYEDEKILVFRQITEDEFAFLSIKKGKIIGKSYYLKFYDMKNENEIKSLKIGEKDKDFNNFVLLNEENLFVLGNESYILVDTKNKIVKKEIKFEIELTEMIALNKNLFLYQYDDILKLYKFDEQNNFELIEELKFEFYLELISKYPGNKLINYTNEGKISILGIKKKK